MFAGLKLTSVACWMQTTLWNGLRDLICCDEPGSKLIYIGSIIVLQLWETLKLLGLCLLLGDWYLHVSSWEILHSDANWRNNNSIRFGLQWSWIHAFRWMLPQEFWLYCMCCNKLQQSEKWAVPCLCLPGEHDFHNLILFSLQGAKLVWPHDRAATKEFGLWDMTVFIIWRWKNVSHVVSFPSSNGLRERK